MEECVCKRHLITDEVVQLRIRPGITFTLCLNCNETMGYFDEKLNADDLISFVEFLYGQPITNYDY